MNKWHIIQTRPRWEKKVYATLVEKGIECYCPLNKVTRQWSDRIKVVEQPLFKSHLFVKICDNQRVHVRITPGVVNFVYGEGKLFNIKDRDIQAIRDLLDENQYLEVLKTEAVPLL
ncbi:MAG TPA: transcription termination/antitermination NusG family protein, partial [Flavisolibacter sp.]|nr:transcription termination/antitermination NusG family protein [Flavisolibacter sp.]